MKSFTVASGLALLLASGASAAPQAVKREAHRSTTVTIQNGSLKQLLYDSQSLQHGEFGSSPPTIIPAGAGNGVDYGVSSFEAESDGFATGDEGTVTYRYDDGTTFALYFDNPQTTGNVYGCNIGGTNPKDYTCTFGDGSGNNADITFTIQPVASKLLTATSTFATIQNGANVPLNFVNSTSTTGKFDSNWQPAQQIHSSPGDGQWGVGNFEAVAVDTSGGDSGNVVYALPDGTLVTFAYTNPVSAQNTYYCGISGPTAAYYSCDWNGTPQADTAMVNYRFYQSKSFDS